MKIAYFEREKKKHIKFRIHASSLKINSLFSNEPTKKELVHSL